FALANDLSFCTIDKLVQYQKQNKSNIKKIVSAKLPTQYGIFDIAIYQELYTNKEHVFLSMGNYRNGPVRIHSECLTGDVFYSQTCDCQKQLDQSLKMISHEKKGAIVYLRQEGRGIGLGEKIKAYRLQQQDKLDTAEANLKLGHPVDQRDYHQAAWILKDQGFQSKIKLITHNPDKIKTLESHGFHIDPIFLNPAVNPSNLKYLTTKKDKMGHLIELHHHD
ncbi:MAG: GTP cyclohydrolase II, partial [Spirochaetes bacterium]|nr:GTP cyclohydrolase II [Spirochaetota bacterium]